MCHVNNSVLVYVCLLASENNEYTQVLQICYAFQSICFAQYRRIIHYNFEAGKYICRLHMTVFILSFSDYITCIFNPLSPHDALKHHFTSLKTYLIFSQPRVLENKFR